LIFCVYIIDVSKIQISLNFNSNEAMKAIAPREMELNKEKKRIIYEQLNGEKLKYNLIEKFM
jgi:hypothetical protein